MAMLTRRWRRAGQTIIYLALLLGILMVVAALVIDVGSTHRVRAQTKYACDAGALAGMAEFVAATSQNPPPGQAAVLAKQRALDILSRHGYSVGNNGVTEIVAFAYNHTTFDPQTQTGPIDGDDSDRYYVLIKRELPQHIAKIIGIGRTGVNQRSVAANLNNVPIDVDLPSQVGFPTRANLSQFGPDGHLNGGDAHSVKFQDKPPNIGQPNPDYDPEGYQYDIFIPPDIGTTGSTFVRVEIFDPDCINKGTTSSTVVKDPKLLVDWDSDLSEPEDGGIDEIRPAPPIDIRAGTNPLQFPSRSTQTEYTLFGSANQLIATASYGPNASTPYYLQTEDPLANPPHAVPAGPLGQMATDLHWITPQGFEFDTATYSGPYRLRVRTTFGTSENGYSLRVSTHRPDGQVFVKSQHGQTATAALAMYARGRIPINFATGAVTNIPIGEIPKEANLITVRNFDADIQAQFVKFTMSGFDALTGQGDYPILFPAPPSATGSNVVVDQFGQKYFTDLAGSLSGDSAWASDTIDIPQLVTIPETDGSGNLVFTSPGQINRIDQRPFEGGQLKITYQAGNFDTSVWHVTFGPSVVPGDNQIILIR